MGSHKLYIKNMVCDRCIKVVREELQKLEYAIERIELGMVELQEEQEVNTKELRSNLAKEGFELLDSNSSRMINSIKSAIIDQVHYKAGGHSRQENFSRMLEKKIGRGYSYLSHLFSTTEGRTIEKFIIQQKVERIKELLKYGEMTISEIAFEMNYSSPNYLSNQFKQVTGLRPSEFRNMLEAGRERIDKV